MKERPILFSALMVRATLEDRKTQTRRIMKQQPEEDWKRIEFYFSETLQRDLHPRENEIFFSRSGRGAIAIQCPYGSVGDRLWVRETHYAFGWWKRNGRTKTGRQKWKFVHEPLLHTGVRKHPVRFDPAGENFEVVKGKGQRGYFKRPSIHMPRWASRITLEITKVRVERLQDISEEDAIAEGCEQLIESGKIIFSAKERFRDLWDSINGKAAWDQNPLVWVLTFKRV